ENVTYVGDYAFQDCTEVTSITLNSKLGYIGDYAFDGCVLVTQLKIPESVGNIGDHFIRGTAIEEIVLPSGLRFIPAFTDNTVIKKVTCESTDIQHLWGSTFANCTALEVADIYSGEWIGSNCFLNCTSLKYFHVDYLTKEIRKSAFEGCSAMTLVTFGGKDSLLETIGEKAFSGCEGITAFDLPKTLKSIGSRAFEKTSITSIIVPAKVQSIGTVPIFDEWSGTHTGYGDSCFYDCPELQRIVFVNRDGEFLPIYSFAEYCPKLAEVFLPSSVGWMSTENGFDMDIFGDHSPWLKYYNQAKLEGYVPTAYYRYGVYEGDNDYSDWTFDSIYKPGDTFTVIPFSGDYDAEVAYWEFFKEQAELCKAEGYDPVEFVSLNEYLKPMTVLSSFGVKVMAEDEDITDKVQINWYINWLEDNVLTTGAKLDGSAMVCDTFRYRFTVTLDEAYAFDFEDYDSGEFELKSTMDGQVVVVNLVKREKGAVEIVLPEEIKNDPSVSVSVLQTQSNLLRELETEIADGKITLQAAPSANLLVYVYCDHYYKYTGSVSADDIQAAIDTNTPHKLTVQMEKLPVSGTFTAKFSIYDILPYGEKEIEMLDGFDGISVEINNITKGTVCDDYTLQFPYVIINNYAEFFETTDELTITVTPDPSLELYGFTAVLNPGDSKDYGDTEGTLNRYGAIYIQPTLPEDSESGRAIVQVYNVAGDRVSIDIVESGELLVRRFADGNYTVTVSEQNRYFNSAERLAQFTTCGWTAGEDYYRTSVKLIAPCYQVLEVETPLAPNSSFLIKRDPLVTRNDKIYNNWQLYNWPYYTELTFDVILDTSFQLRNTTLLLSVPANMDLFHICQAEQAFGTQMTYTDRYLSEDGKTMYYEYPIGDLTQKLGRLQLMVYLRYAEDIISFDQITDQYCTATIITDATVDGTASRYYAPAGSINMLDKDMLSYLVYVSHAPTISDKTGITAMVTAPAGSEVDLYADGELVAQGITNYTGMAVLRYDAPFQWLWWEYEVYAVVRLANTGIEFTTDPVSVECNEDLATPVKIEGEIVIRDAETGEVVFPTSYDPDNIISVNFKTGERKNIVLRSMLDSSDGKRYDIYETFRVTFDNNAAGYARDAAIVIRYTDAFGSEKEEYLWTEYNEDSGCYLSTKVIRNVAYDPATLLTVMQLPTHMGVEWETAADAVGITLMPGQIEALAEQLNETEETPFGALFGEELSLENMFYALQDPVKNDPLFPYYPAQMQADIISDYQFGQDIHYAMSNAFTEAFGFSVDDMAEDDFVSMMSYVKSGTIDESVTAASLRQRGFTEIPVYGEENGVFMTSTDSGIEVYDFSANYYMSYDTEAWMDVLNAYIPEQNMQVMTMRAAALSEDEAPKDSLSKYVDGIHDEYVAELIDSTMKEYESNQAFFEDVLSKALTDLLNAIDDKFDDNAWYDYMFGSKNPAISGLNNLIGEGLSMLKGLDPLKLDWDWKTQGLINAYYDDGGMPHAELTDAGYNYLQDSDLNFIGDVFDFEATQAGKLVEQGYASIVKGYNIEAVKAQQLAHGVVENGGNLIMDFKT
ncbi:MAG: leucine-rich repeat domain-containing protein, partial [Clostridia bacterium]|nr:leucine-rich repeat domain-containing protein [Clostridia bacterium]